MWKFSEHKGSNTLVTVYWCNWHFRCPIPANTGVGYCLFVFGSFHNLRSDKLIGLTLSLFIITAHSGLVGKQKTYFIMKRLFLLLAVVGLLFTACSPGGGLNDDNTEQPGGGNQGNPNAPGNPGDIPADKTKAIKFQDENAKLICIRQAP